jgi:hypothetical protein
MGTIRDTVVEDFVLRSAERDKEWEERHSAAEPLRLFGSDVGGCERKAYLNMLRVEHTHPFDNYLLELFGLGYEAEEKLARHLLSRFPETNRERKVRNNIWSARIDFFIEPAVYPELPAGAIVECKGTSHWNFMHRKEGDRLPYEHHVWQVLLQKKLLGIDDIPTYLYYLNWNNWAEIEVYGGNGWAGWEGEINGREASGHIDCGLEDELVRFEWWWNGERSVPPAAPYDSYNQEDFACTKDTRAGRMVACPFYGHCWSEEPNG